MKIRRKLFENKKDFERRKYLIENSFIIRHEVKEVRPGPFFLVEMHSRRELSRKQEIVHVYTAIMKNGMVESLSKNEFEEVCNSRCFYTFREGGRFHYISLLHPWAYDVYLYDERFLGRLERVKKCLILSINEKFLNETLEELKIHGVSYHPNYSSTIISAIILPEEYYMQYLRLLEKYNKSYVNDIRLLLEVT